MAISENLFNFTGRIAGLTFYRRGDNGKIIVRPSKGVDPHRLRNDACFGKTRQLNTEFRALNLLCKYIYTGLSYFKSSFNINVYNQLLKRLVVIQQSDKNSEIGRRELAFSQHGHLIKNISFNNRYSIDQVITGDLQFEVDKEKGEAIVRIPQLIPGINFNNPTGLPFFRINLSLQPIPDIRIVKGEPVDNCIRTEREGYYESPWFPMDQPMEMQTIKVKLDTEKPGPHTLVLCMVLSFSKGNDIAVRHAGAGKVLEVI